MGLSDAKIRAAKPRAHRYRLTDDHGLSVEIAPTGKRHWRYRYRLDGKETIFCPGQWCRAPIGETVEQAEARRAGGLLTLAEARVARVTWRAQVVGGQHPRIARQAARLLGAQSAANTFSAVAAEFVAQRGAGWGASHRAHFLRFIQQDANPDLGALPIASIGPAHVLAVLRKVEARGAYSVARLGRGYLGQVCRFAVASHKATQDPTRALAGALTKTTTRHHPPIPQAELGAFLRALSMARSDRPTEIAVRLLALTMTRTVELRGARWSEIDMASAEWRLPAERMKARRPHVVPLSKQALELLAELRPLSGRNAFLFPNTHDPDKPMGSSTLGRVFDRSGYGGRYSPHSLRSTASTLLREAGFDDRLIEMQLAHIDRDKTRAAYNSAEQLEPRRRMLQAWADLLDAALIVAG